MTQTVGLVDGYEGGNPRAKALTAEGHREWCRRRALHYLNQQQVGNALAGLIADLSRHEDTKGLIDKVAALPTTYESAMEFITYL